VVGTILITILILDENRYVAFKKRIKDKDSMKNRINFVNKKDRGTGRDPEGPGSPRGERLHGYETKKVFRETAFLEIIPPTVFRVVPIPRASRVRLFLRVKIKSHAFKEFKKEGEQVWIIKSEYSPGSFPHWFSWHVRLKPSPA
jgi:hypothetical protein